MKRRGLTSLLLLLAIKAVIPDAQLAQTMEDSKFKLTLSIGHSPELSRNILKLVVRLTNVSNGMIREDPCSAGMYKLSVVYNGIPMEESEEARKRRESIEAAEAKGGLCSGSNPGRHIKPGEHWEDPIYYDAGKPGTYEFTVEEKTFPGHPGTTQVVKSNTLTVVVPEPEAEAPK